MKNYIEYWQYSVTLQKQKRLMISYHQEVSFHQGIFGGMQAINKGKLRAILHWWMDQGQIRICSLLNIVLSQR